MKSAITHSHLLKGRGRNNFPAPKQKKAQLKCLLSRLRLHFFPLN